MRTRVGMKAIPGEPAGHEQRGKSLDDDSGQPFCQPLRRGLQRGAAPSQQTSAYSMTSSARASTVSGTVRPSVLAVLTLIVSSYLIGCCTGNSATFAPLRIRSTYDAARLYESSTSDA